MVESSVQSRWLTFAGHTTRSPARSGEDCPSIETNPVPSRHITSISIGAECSSMVAPGANLKLAMTIPALFNITRPVTPTVPSRGSGCQVGLGIFSIMSAVT